MNSEDYTCGRKLFAAAVLFSLIFLIYSNTFSASWQMDDHPNIVFNDRLHITALTQDQIFRSLFANPQISKFKELYRPVACLSFGLNWFFGKDDVSGFHLVNITIHFITAFLLYATILALWDCPRLKNRIQGQPHVIALLTAALWAIHPIQTQAVTYIVQRMAAMAALFYLLSIYFYIKARLNDTPQRRGLFFAAGIISYFLAIGSKENAAILPLALIMVEIIFFQNPNWTKINRKLLWIAAGGGLFVFLTGTLFFLKGDFFSFVNGYGIRPFTLGERLLTEPRILIFYLSQIILPLPGRLSIAHDVTVYRSLFNPVATLPAIFLVLLLIGFSIWRLKKWPIVSFGILFFFLNHLIESTIIPLELLFEHRNYLPTMFLFWPLAVGLSRLVEFTRQHHTRMLKWAVSVCIILMIWAMGVGTYRRNAVWATEKSLWEDALQKAPGIARPYLVLAAEYEKQDEFEKALRYYKKSLTLPDQRPRQSRGSAYNNMGTMYLKRHDYETAITLYQQALALRPLHSEYLHNLVIALIKARNWQQASAQANLLVTKYSNNATYLNLKSYLLLKQGRPEEAIGYLRKALSLAPRDRNVIVNYGLALSLAGKTGQAARVLNKINKTYPADIAILMGLIENSLRAGDEHGLDGYANRLMATFSVGDVRNFLQALEEDKIEVPLTPEILAPALGNKIRQKIKKAG